jgi:hypothetical protein
LLLLLLVLVGGDRDLTPSGKRFYTRHEKIADAVVNSIFCELFFKNNYFGIHFTFTCTFECFHFFVVPIFRSKEDYRRKVKQEVLFLISTRSDTDDDDDDDDDDDAKRNITKIDEYNIFVGSIK